MRLDKASFTFIRNFKATHDFFYSLYAMIAPRFENDLNARGKIFMKKSTAEWLLWLLLNKQIDIGKYDYIETLNDYNLNDMQKNDIVLDIGAGAGLYSLLAGLLAKKVYSIEPLLTKQFYDFTRDAKNITFLPFAFGKNNQELLCKYWNMKKHVLAHDLNYILNYIESGVTVVKCDCEGCEWAGFLNCVDFKSIRKIELEYHTNDKNLLHKLIQHLHSHDFSVVYTPKVSCDYKHIGLLEAEKRK